jgi:hypothetical protein
VWATQWKKPFFVFVEDKFETIYQKIAL